MLNQYQWRIGSILVSLVLLAACDFQNPVPTWRTEYASLDGVWHNADRNVEWSFDMSSDTVVERNTYGVDSDGNFLETIVRFKIHDLTENRLQLYATLVQIRPSNYPKQEPTTQDTPEPGSYYFVVDAAGFLVQLDIARYVGVSSENIKEITTFSEYIIRDRDYFPQYHQVTLSTGSLNTDLEEFVKTHAIQKNTGIAAFDQTTYVKNIYEKTSNVYREVDNYTVVYSFIIYDRYGNYRWQLENNRFKQPGSTPTPEERALIADGWELQKEPFPRTYIIQYDAATQTLTLHDGDGNETILTRKED